MLVRLFNSIIDVSTIISADIFQPQYGRKKHSGYTCIRCLLNIGDKVYIQFDNESDARSGFDALQSLLEATSLGNDSMYEEPVVLEGTVDEVKVAMATLQELIEKNQSKTSESYDDGVEFEEGK